VFTLMMKVVYVAFGQHDVPDRKSVQSSSSWGIVFRAHADSINFNGVVLIGDSTGILFHEAYGFQELDATAKGILSKDAPFYLASVSKTFVAAAVLKLVEHGKLQLSNSVLDVFPSVDKRYEKISIKHLLNHTSGLPNDYTDYYDTFSSTEFDNRSLFSLFLKGGIKLEFSPGEQHAYSNVGYVMLALIIEKVSGMNLCDFINTHLTHHSPMMRLFGKDAGTFVSSYFVDSLATWQVYETGVYDGVEERTYGDGGLVGSAMDLYLWGLKLMQHEILQEESLTMMFAPGYLNDGTHFNYGMGIRVFPERNFYYHGGASWGYSHIFALYPDKKLIVVLLSNNDLWGEIGILFKEIEQVLIRPK
jgi:CubicO group peptidase (beta-lactamase class C family)